MYRVIGSGKEKFLLTSYAASDASAPPRLCPLMYRGWYSAWDINAGGRLVMDQFELLTVRGK